MAAALESNAYRGQVPYFYHRIDREIRDRVQTLLSPPTG